MRGVMTGFPKLDKTRLCDVEKNGEAKAMADLTFKQRVNV